MAGEWIATVGDPKQLGPLISGEFLKGKREPRVAMVGRSNVGKSSLINAILGQRLAQVSAEPGKTRLIHFYSWLEGGKIIADLPGYGFARASHSERDKWAKLIQAYMKADLNLRLALLLLDARHGPTELDQEAFYFLRDGGMPVQVVFTKLDALKTQKERADRKRDASSLLEQMGLDPEDAAWVSSKTGDSLSYLFKRIREAGQ
ncbi:MAG: ribosome biogenesis GTP-binding protein YihA/YsxC [Oligoflexia bacterium]